MCIPIEVLRAQNDDTSALLRPPPRRSDQLRQLVDMSVERTLEKLRSPGGTGILEAAVWMPGRKNGAETEAATGWPTMRPRVARRL